MIFKVREKFAPYYYKGIETNIEVSKCGYVRRVKDGKEYNLRTSTNGYSVIKFKYDGKVKHRVVHRLVIETFGPPQPTENHQVDHLDGNKLNNHISNLEWVTGSENIKRAFRMGLKRNRLKEAIIQYQF